MRGLTLELLGGFDVRAADGAVVGIPTQKYRALLAFLAMPPGRFHSRDTLTALLWDELPHEQARSALRQALWALRRTLKTHTGDVLVQDGDAIAIDAHSVRSDVDAFVAAAAHGERASLELAASLYRGVLLAGFPARESPFEDWLTGERERLGQLALASLSRLLALQRADGSLDHAVQTALRLLALDPLQEDVHRTLMAIYLELGRRGAALRQYQNCLSILQRELGADPDHQTRALYHDIVQRPSPRVGADRGPVNARSADQAPTAVFEAPLVGRERELAMLRTLWADVLEGAGRVAFVTGEAGIGKSRLVAEITNEAAAHGAHVMLGRAYETAKVLPFGPWAEALRDASIMDDDVVATLPPVSRQAIARVLPELGRAEAAAPSAIESITSLFDGVLGLLAARAQKGPLVIVLEDVHWADDMTVRLASFVARRLASPLRILFILTLRDECSEPGTVLQRLRDDLDREIPLMEVGLGALGHDATCRLVRSLLPRDRADVIERAGEAVFAASEGHPLMIVEMTRSLEPLPDSDVVPQITLPQRVRRLIERRFEQLDANGRQALTVAAVIGRNFDYRLFQRACGMGEDAAVASLEQLVRRRVVHAAGDGFEFTHDRLREVAYAELIPPRRKLLHRRVAEALTEVRSDHLEEHHAAIGTHYAEAGVADRAARHLYEAARVARDRLAYREGIVLLERALEALARLPRTRDTIVLEIDTRLQLFRCLNALGSPGASEQVTRAQAMVADVGDEARAATILVEVAELRRFQRDLHGALDAGTRALAVAERIDARPLGALAHFQVGVAHFTLGAYREALVHLASTVERCAQAPLREQLGYPYIPALCRLSWAHTDLGDLDEARRYADTAMRVAHTGEHAPSLVEAWTALGVLSVARGAPADALAPLERAAHLARHWNLPYLRSFSFSWLALVYAQCGRLDEARTLLDECEALRVWEHVRLQWSRIVVRLGEARLLLGQAPHAARLAERGLALASSIGEPAGEVEAQVLKARLAHQSGSDRGASRLHLEKAIEGALRIGLQALARRLRTELMCEDPGVAPPRTSSR
jgi:DNA-binding SARP family transcriptional activator